MEMDGYLVDMDPYGGQRTSAHAPIEQQVLGLVCQATTSALKSGGKGGEEAEEGDEEEEGKQHACCQPDFDCLRMIHVIHTMHARSRVYCSGVECR